MAHGYHTLQHWDHWLAHEFLGSRILEDESQIFAQLLQAQFGKHALLIGVPHQAPLLKSLRIPCHYITSPLAKHTSKIQYFEADFNELPILTASVDVVMLPHTLEFVDNPRKLLAEACRIVKPEGVIVICGFNPYSFWGLKKKFSTHKKSPWLGNLIPVQKIKIWLKLIDFHLEQQKTIFYRPPLKQTVLFERLHVFEKIGTTCFPLMGGVYILLARAKVIPLTPIRLRWKQQVSSIRLSTGSGYIARRSK